MMYLKADQPVNDYGTAYLGIGRPMTLLSSPAVNHASVFGDWCAGNITVLLPSGGSVPAAALYNYQNPDSGGPLDGVLQGAPWDVPFVDHWRQLCIQNDAATGVRSTYVDGYLMGTSSASTNFVPAATAVTIGAACPIVLSELLVWDGATMTPANMAQTCRAHSRMHPACTLGPSASSGT